MSSDQEVLYGLRRVLVLTGFAENEHLIGSVRINSSLTLSLKRYQYKERNFFERRFELRIYVRKASNTGLHTLRVTGAS